MSFTQTLREKVLFWKDFYPTQYNIYRNRGDHFVLEQVGAVRIKKKDEINRHRLETGEELPAAPLKYVSNKLDGTPLVHAVEADDGQLVVWKPEFQPDNVERAANMLETDMDRDQLLQDLDKAQNDIMQLSVLDNREERKTFLAEELEISNDKYTLSSIINENQGAVYALATGLAVAIIIYATASNFGDYIPVLKEFTQAASNLNPGQLASSTGGGSPPTQ